MVVILLPALAGSTCNQNPPAETCPATDPPSRFFVVGILNNQAFVTKEHVTLESSVQRTRVRGLASVSLITFLSNTVFCDHNGARFGGKNAAWLADDGLHVQNLETGSEIYADASIATHLSTSGSGIWVEILGLSDDYVLIRQYDFCGNGCESLSVFTKSFEGGESQTLVSDSYPFTLYPKVIMQGHLAAITGSDPNAPSDIRIVDLSTRDEHNLTSPGPGAPYPIEVSETRLTWKTKAFSDTYPVGTLSIFGADLPSGQPQKLAQFNLSSDFPDRPIADVSGDNMLVRRDRLDQGPEYDLWSLADPPGVIRNLGAIPAAPYFAGGMIVAPQTPEGPFDLIDPATDARTTVPNPFLP